MTSRIELVPVVTGSPDGVLVIGAGGAIQFANPMAEYLLGRRAADLLGRGLDLAVVPDDAFVLALSRPDGDEVVLEVRVVAAPWLGEMGCVLWLRDIAHGGALDDHLRLPTARKTRVSARVRCRPRPRPAHPLGHLRGQSA